MPTIIDGTAGITYPVVAGATSAVQASSGKVLQVVSTTKTDTFSTASTTFVDLTGLSVSITPTSTSSKILVLVNTNYSPSAVSGEGEKTDPIYATGMDDFDLFATLEELLKENPEPKKDTKKSKDKTKMATGGHLDDLLAEQMTVDDLLKLLR